MIGVSASSSFATRPRSAAVSAPAGTRPRRAIVSARYENFMPAGEGGFGELSQAGLARALILREL